MRAYDDVVLLDRLDVIPTLRSLEAWRARVEQRDVTLVCPRPEVIEAHLGKQLRYSNLEGLDEDLQEIASRAPAPHELRLLEIRRVEGGQVPLGLFEPYEGWPLREIAKRVTSDPSVAAVVALEIFRSYSSDEAATMVTPTGALVRRTLPQFPRTWTSEMPSFAGSEPEISIRWRIAEGRTILAKMSDTLTNDDRDENNELSAQAFVAELERLADRASAGPTLAARMANLAPLAGKST
ncbi:MAG: hypothetical protein R3B48_11970 [Kofleriaceae bacterium]